MIREAYVSSEIAEFLQEKGFNVKCHCHYWAQDKGYLFYSDIEQNWNSASEDWYSCPTHQMTCAWLREAHNIYICPKLCCFQGSGKKDKPYYKWEARILSLPTGNIISPQYGILNYYETYEDAVDAALLYIKDNKLI